MQKPIYIASYPGSGGGAFLEYVEDTFTPCPQFIQCSDFATAWDFRKPAIFVFRDGRDTLAAHASMIVEGGSDDRPYCEVLRRLIEGKHRSPNVAEPRWHWGNYCTAWLRRPMNTVLVKYEEWIENPCEVAGNAFRALRVDATPRVTAIPQRLVELRKESPRMEMTPALEELFWAEQGRFMDMLEYTKEKAA